MPIGGFTPTCDRQIKQNSPQRSGPENGQRPDDPGSFPALRHHHHLVRYAGTGFQDRPAWRRDGHNRRDGRERQETWVGVRLRVVTLGSDVEIPDTGACVGQKPVQQKSDHLVSTVTGVFSVIYF